MRLSEFGPFSDVLASVNPQATNGTGEVAGIACRNVLTACELPDNTLTVERGILYPETLRGYMEGRRRPGLTVLYTHGGDGSLQRDQEGITGTIRDNPDATASNVEKHRDLAKHLLHIAGAGGNANNYAASTLGPYARSPLMLAYATDLTEGEHIPLIFELSDEDGRVIRNGIITSCVGVGVTEKIVRTLDAHKQAAKQLEARTFGPGRRLARERRLAVTGLLHAEPFSADITINRGLDSITEEFTDITGFELIGSSVYAKEGRTRVHIGDTRHQVVIGRKHPYAIADTAALLATGARLRTGRHKRKPVDFLHHSIDVQVRTPEGVRFHVDGEFDDERYRLLPGQTLHLRLGEVGVRALLRQR